MEVCAASQALVYVRKQVNILISEEPPHAHNHTAMGWEGTGNNCRISTRLGKLPGDLDPVRDC